MLVTLLAWWSARTRREKWILGSGLVLIGFYILVFLIWQPLNHAVQQQRQLIQRNVNLTHWLGEQKTIIDRYKAAGFVPHNTASTALLATVEQSLASTKVAQYVSNTQSDGDKQITLTFTGVPFDQLMEWVETAWKQDNVIVIQSEIQPTAISGAVNARMTLGHLERANSK